jgi:hypothetical protein
MRFTHGRVRYCITNLGLDYTDSDSYYNDSDSYCNESDSYCYESDSVTMVIWMLQASDLLWNCYCTCSGLLSRLQIPDEGLGRHVQVFHQGSLWYDSVSDSVFILFRFRPLIFFGIVTVLASAYSHGCKYLMKDLGDMSKMPLTHYISSHLSVIYSTVVPVLLLVSFFGNSKFWITRL